MEHCFAPHPACRNIHHIRQSVFGRINNYSVNAFQLLPCIFVKLRYFLIIFINIEFLAGNSERCNQRQCLCTGADFLFLLAAVLVRNNANALFYVQRTAPLWCVNLVCADGNQIRTKPPCVNSNFSERLNSVCVADCVSVLFLNSRKNLAYRHYRTGFVVDAHNGNKDCAFINLLQNAFGSDNSVLVR